MDQEASPAHRVRWGLIALVTVIGILVTAAPFALVLRAGPGFGDWRALTSATLTNVGTTLLLVAGIWFLERTFTSRIVTAVQETTRQVVAEETGDIVANQRDLSLRLDELQARLENRAADGVREQDAVIQRLADGISFESVRAALEEVDAMGGLWFHQVTIPAGTGGPNQPRFVFRVSAAATGQPLHRLQPGDYDIRPIVEIEWEAPEDRPGSRPMMVPWESGVAADEILDKLRREMIVAGFAQEARRLDARVFANLHAALREAIAGRREDPGAWLQSPLDEWVSDDWAVTRDGLEHRGPHGMGTEEFPRDWDGRSNEEARTWEQPDPPEGIDEEFWNFLIRRARRRHRPGPPLHI